MEISVISPESSKQLTTDVSLLTPVQRRGNGLVDCLPNWLRRLFGIELIELVIDTSLPQWQAALHRLGKKVKLFAGDGLDGPEGLRDAIIQATRLRATVTMLVPTNAVLIRKVRFPSPTPERLRRDLNRDTLSYELDRFTPFPNTEVYHEFRFGSDVSKSHVEIDLAVVKKTTVDDRLKRLQEIGGSVDIVSWPGAWPTANMIPPKQHRRVLRKGRAWNSVLLLLLIILGIAVLVSPLIQKRAIVIELMTMVDKAKLEAAKVGNLRTKIEENEKSTNFVVEQKRQANYTIAMLARLTDLVPDDAWVNLLNYANGEVDISGEAKQATALIEILAKDAAFRNSSFRSPVTALRATGNERFNIQFNYVGLEVNN